MRSLDFWQPSSNQITTKFAGINWKCRENAGIHLIDIIKHNELWRKCQNYKKRYGMQEVGGSIPPGSTNPFKGLTRLTLVQYLRPLQTIRSHEEDSFKNFA
jgi:hypothetical protein